MLSFGTKIMGVGITMTTMHASTNWVEVGPKSHIFTKSRDSNHPKWS